MDCIDCHNRPAHTMAVSAERAVNEAMARGEFPPALPFVHREAVKALKTRYPTEDAAASGIAASMRVFYRAAQPPDVEKAVEAAQRIYRGNIFPAMNVGFGTYPNNIGHVDSNGCFRCHDDRHVAKDGKTINQDCETCHKIQ